MSIFSSSTTWGCPTVNQSPINLAQSSAKPCDLLCDISIEETYPSQGSVIVSDEGLILHNQAGLGSCKYNSEGYTCTFLSVNHPSQHTIENIQADAEVIATFTNPTGKYLCISSLVRVNPSQTSNTAFFSAFVGYGNPSVTSTDVVLGDNWTLGMMVPSGGGYFMYEGSTVSPPCQPTTWIVFKNMINIDSTDFATLIRNNQAGSRPIQPTADREVFYNSSDGAVGGVDPSKKLMRCKRVSKKPKMGGMKEITTLPLADKSKAETEKQKKSSGVTKFVSDQIAKNGYIAILDIILAIVALSLGVFFGSQSSTEPYAILIPQLYQMFGSYIRSWFKRPPTSMITQ